MGNTPKKIKVRGAKVHNLKNINVDIPLNQIVAITGVSGSGKSSLAMGVLYSEGSRRYLESLSTYTRRRMTSATKAQVDEVLYVPAALALHQRPAVPGIRSTFGTGTELLNSLRLMYSRLAKHCCKNGHYIEPTLNVAAEKEIICPICKEKIHAPSAEELAFNSQGACLKCGGTGIVRTVDIDSLVPDKTLTIDEGAVVPWNSLMWTLMTDVCRAMGVRTDVPFNQLTDEEKNIVYYGPAEKKHIFYKAKNTDHAGEMDFTYFNATYTVENALSKVKDDKGMKRVEKFLKEEICPECQGTRLSKEARKPLIRGIGLDKACQMPLNDLVEWVRGIPDSMPDEMKPMAREICDSFLDVSKRLLDLGLGYLSLDRAASTLSTGERQRMQLARAVRNRTTGILYVLDEPSIGLHQRDNEKLIKSLQDIRDLGNSVLVVEHDEDTMRASDFIVDIGPGAGVHGGQVICAGTPEEVMNCKDSITGQYLSGNRKIEVPQKRRKGNGLFIEVKGAKEHNLKNINVKFPLGKFNVVTGVSGSGKSTLVNDILGKSLMRYVYQSKERPGLHKEILGIENIDKVIEVSQDPIGRTPRSNPVTYTGVFDDIRDLFAQTNEAKMRGYDKGRFSFNVKGGRCEACQGDGLKKISMHFLPDVYVPCEQCEGKRYNEETLQVTYKDKNIYDVLEMTVEEAVDFFDNLPKIRNKIQTLYDVGLGYIKLGQSATTLSGGEAQRVKLASELQKKSTGKTVYILDEPTTGLHSHDVARLIDVLQRIVDQGDTIIVIEHNLDVIKVADHIIDLGPEGGAGGGTIVVTGTPEKVAKCEKSYTGQFLKSML